MTRIEKDLLGERELLAEALHGIYTLRAVGSFPLSGRRVNAGLIHAYGQVKLACAMANHELGFFDDPAFGAVSQACREMADGLLDEHILVDALQGGAGTATNMNVNEVLTNRALRIMGRNPGEYDVIHPIQDLNRHQSTNDTYPTALRVALIVRVRDLEKKLIRLVELFQAKETAFADIVKVGRTQMQDATLLTLGREMAAYAEAFGRDRWRIYKCEERLRVVNLGGTAVGTGLAAPRKYIFAVTEHLKRITGLGLARAENLVEATQNQDALVEVSGILNACATNLMKTASDLRLLSSGPHAGIGEISLPARMAGSSIMPGKVNPVIPEAVTQAAMVATGNNAVIAQAAGMGCLELNPFLPLMADKLLETLTLLTNACGMLADLCVEGITANPDRCRRHIHNATATVTALIPVIGYEKAQNIAREVARENTSVKEAVIGAGLLTEEQFDTLVSPEAVNRLGSRSANR
jgi:aspartate ammonia-lyase